MQLCDVQYTVMWNAYNIQCAIVQSVMQSQSGGLSMQFCDVHHTMCHVYNIQCAILQSVMQSQSGLLPMQCVMQNVQCAVCDVHFLLRSWKIASAESSEGLHYIPSGILYSQQHLLSSKTNCASVFLVFLITLKEVHLPCAFL